MKAFSLNVEDGYLIDSSEYYSLLSTMLRIDIGLDNLIAEYNTYLTNTGVAPLGLYPKYSEKPIVLFPLEIELSNNDIMIVDNIYELEEVVANYENIKTIGRIQFKEFLKIRKTLSGSITYPYFLDAFSRHLELEYNRSVINSEFIYKSPFNNKQEIFLVNPNLNGYEHLYSFLETKQFDNVFVKNAVNVFESYLTKINDLAPDPYKTIKVTNYLNLIKIDFEPSVMDKWGCIQRELYKSEKIRKRR